MDKPVVVNRRVFFLGVAVGVPLCSVVLASTGALAQTAATDATKAPAGASAAPALKLLPDNDATAKALGYSPDATTAQRVAFLYAADERCRDHARRIGLAEARRLSGGELCAAHIDVESRARGPEVHLSLNVEAQRRNP